MRTLEDAHTRIDSLEVNGEQHAARIRQLEKMLDTRATHLCKRILFRIDGWPSWSTVAVRPSWRPWRRWWTS